MKGNWIISEKVSQPPVVDFASHTQPQSLYTFRRTLIAYQSPFSPLNTHLPHPKLKSRSSCPRFQEANRPGHTQFQPAKLPQTTPLGMPRLLILALALLSFCVFPISPFSLSPDASFQSWCERNDIYSSRVSCRTTEDSVGGRGLFADHDVKEGEVLATIPKRLLLTSSDKTLWAGEIAGKAKDAEPAIDEWVATW